MNLKKYIDYICKGPLFNLPKSSIKILLYGFMCVSSCINRYINVCVHVCVGATRNAVKYYQNPKDTTIVHLLYIILLQDNKREKSKGISCLCKQIGFIQLLLYLTSVRRLEIRIQYTMWDYMHQTVLFATQRKM